jgi:hypothetical protein
LNKNELKLLEWLGGIASTAAVGFGAWVHSQLTRLDRDVAVLKYTVLGVAAAPSPSLLMPAEREPVLAFPLPFALPMSPPNKGVP